MLITLNNTTYQRNGFNVFKPVSMKLNTGQICLISGANGAGKTTFLECLTGLKKFSSGQAFVENECSYQNHNQWLRNICYIGHKLGFSEHLSCLENILFTQSLITKKQDKKNAHTILKNARLYGYEHQNTNKLSAGQKKRLSLARLLIAKKPLWILDEPYAHLDELTKHWLSQLINEHIKQNGSVILTAHENIKFQHDTLKIQLETANS